MRTNIVRNFIILTSLFFLSLGLSANTNLDSLQNFLFKKNLEQEEKISLFINIAEEYSEIENYPQAIINYNEALNLVELDGDKIFAADIYNKLGIAYRMINDYGNSLNCYLEALRLLGEFGDVKTRSSVLMNIGVIYTDIEEFDNALEYLQRSIDIYEEHGGATSSSIVVHYLNIGIVYSLMKDYDQGLYYYNKAIELLSPEKDREALAGLYNNIGVVYENQEKYKEALDYYNDALKIFEDINIKGGIGTTLMNIGEIYSKQGDYNEAIENIDNAIGLFKEIGRHQSIVESYDRLSEIYAAMGDFNKAYVYNDLGKELNDSLFGPKVSASLAKIQMKYEIEKIEKKRRLEIELLEKDKQLDNYRWIVIVGILIIVLIVVASLFNRRIHQKKLVDIKLKNTKLEKLRLHDELEFKNRELTNFALYVVKKKEFIEEIKQSIEGAKAVQKDDVAMNKIITLLNVEMSQDKDRKDFEIYVDQVNESFFYKLQKKFPDLTEKETRLASLLLLNLSSKEISLLMNISPASVDKSRYRLRKKMNIDTTQNISKFLNGI